MGPEESIVFRNRETNVPEAGGALGFGPPGLRQFCQAAGGEATSGSWSDPSVCGLILSAQQPPVKVLCVW